MSASLTDNQLYELRPVSALNMCMAVSGGSRINGARIVIAENNWAANEQKWIAEDGGSSGWTLRCMETLSYPIVWWNISNPFVAGHEIVQWNGGSENRWLTPVQVDTVTIDGTECPVVVFKIKAHDGVSFSVSDALYYGTNAVTLADTDTTAETQQWVCIPTVARDFGVSAPYDLDVIGDTAKAAAASISYSVTPTWKVAPAIANRSGMSYLMRYRSRFMDLSSAWGEWTDFTLWDTATVTQDGVVITDTEPLEATITSEYKLAEIEYEVRSCVPGSGDGSVWDRPWAGAATSYTATLYVKPAVTLSGGTWSPGGISATAASTYGSRGATEILVTSVTLANKEILTEPYQQTIIGSSGALTIPQEILTGFPDNGDSVKITYRTGSEFRMFAGATTKTLTISYTAGSFTPTITDGTDLDLLVNAGNTARVWVRIDGAITECERTSSGKFSVVYPFGREYEIFAAGESSGTAFAWTSKRTETTLPVHAWNWSGGFCCLEVQVNDPLSVDDSYETISETYALDARPYENVSFSDTRRHRFTATGITRAGLTKTQRGGFDDLAGKHVLYRSPAGDMFPVAVTSVKRDAISEWTQVSVSMTRESV